MRLSRVLAPIYQRAKPETTQVPTEPPPLYRIMYQIMYLCTVLCYVLRTKCLTSNTISKIRNPHTCKWAVCMHNSSVRLRMLEASAAMRSHCCTRDAAYWCSILRTASRVAWCFAICNKVETYPSPSGLICRNIHHQVCSSKQLDTAYYNVDRYVKTSSPAYVTHNCSTFLH